MNIFVLFTSLILNKTLLYFGEPGDDAPKHIVSLSTGVAVACKWPDQPRAAVHFYLEMIIIFTTKHDKSITGQKSGKKWRKTGVKSLQVKQLHLSWLLDVCRCGREPVTAPPHAHAP